MSMPCAALSSILPQGRFQFWEQGQVGGEPIDLGQGVPVQPPGGLGLVQDDLSLGHDTPEAVHVQVKGGVVILDRVEPFSHLHGDGKLLLGACCGVSPASTFPPGNSHWPLLSPYPLAVAKTWVGWFRSSQITAATTRMVFIAGPLLFEKWRDSFSLNWNFQISLCK